MSRQQRWQCAARYVGRGCLIGLAVFVLLAACVAWQVNRTEDRNERRAAADLRSELEAGQARLRAVADDGVVMGTEISRALSGGRAVVRGEGTRWTATVELEGAAAGIIAGTRVQGCYRFSVRGPRVTTRSLDAGTCRELWRAGPRAPHQVARDIGAELRIALVDGDLVAGKEADVWRTNELLVTHQILRDGVLTTWARLPAADDDEHCYTFRATAEPRSVTYEKIDFWDCFPPPTRS